MSYLQLTESTGRTALHHLPETSPLPAASLSPSQSATALAAAQTQAHHNHHTTLTGLAAHLRSIATFAETVTTLDSDVAGALHHA